MAGSVVRVTIVMLGILCGVAAVGAQGQTFTLLHAFTNGDDGGFPAASVILDSSGNIYGTTRGGGTNSLGTVFRFDPEGNETVLHSFAGSPGDGAGPEADLLADAAGNLYGTTTYGGAHDVGTVFKIDSNGHYSVLHSFKKTGDAQYPNAGLIRDKAGSLYGAASGGGTAGRGAVYMISNTGRESLLYSFHVSPDGSDPFGDLLRDGSGNLYGTTYSGGAHNSGTVFKLNPKRQETVVFSLPGGTEGGAEYPQAGLIRDAKGNLYGTSLSYVQFKEKGTIFKIDSAGKQTVLHEFTGGADGADPRSRLVRDKNGNLYGTARVGGAVGCGTVFKLDTSGTLTVLHSFTGLDGCAPKAGVTLDSQGNLYGTTFQSVVSGEGTLFKITP
jgi:uncharacterized repeat protein (TIGR03803 family)